MNNGRYCICAHIAIARYVYIHLPITESISFTECGLAPNVTLNCNNGSAHVEWVASQPACQYDCTARWTCKNHTNSTDPHMEVVSSCLEYLNTHM